jgi:SAM-dependent methyltransferase
MHSNINIFSINSGNYKKFRPSYPKELFEYLASISPSTNAAWDAGCGSGQASIAISDYFTNVIATDISDKQIKKAYRKENVRYLSCPSECSNLDNNSIDLILCAQSIHWFDLKKFYNEVTRVLKPQGILAAWTYNLLRINEEIDNIIDKFYYDIIYNYWPSERKHVENGYKDISFPFNRMKTPSFTMTANWNYEQLIGYLNTWTGVLNYIELEAFNPIEFIEKDLLGLWGKDNNEFKSISWPLTLIIGRMN